MWFKIQKSKEKEFRHEMMRSALWEELGRSRKSRGEKKKTGMVAKEESVQISRGKKWFSLRGAGRIQGKCKKQD